MFRTTLAKPFFSPEGEGAGASGAPTPDTPAASGSAVDPSGTDVTGLVNKNTELLAELKTEKLKKTLVKSPRSFSRILFWIILLKEKNSGRLLIMGQLAI